MACQEEVRDDEPTEAGKGKPAPYYGQSDDAQWRKAKKTMHSASLIMDSRTMHPPSIVSRCGYCNPIPPLLLWSAIAAKGSQAAGEVGSMKSNLDHFRSFFLR